MVYVMGILVINNNKKSCEPTAACPWKTLVK
jgi:hypothetical protein